MPGQDPEHAVLVRELIREQAAAGTTVFLTTHNMTVADELREVSSGDILYVKATEDHSFFEIEEDMTLLVMFATTPPERN